MDINDTGVPSNSGFDPEFAAAADWARLYRSAGVQIVPCKNKVPRLKSWKEYQHELVPDAQFEAWYGRNGEFAQSYDMGALTGMASGRMLMIDLDLYKAGGENAVRWWCGVLLVHNSGLEPETWKQETGGGGRQLFFTYPPNWRSAVNAKTDINVDVRCQGGFAVLPPTKHASGKSYAWEPGSSPWEIPIAPAPDWLLEEVERLIREHGGGQTASNGTEKINMANPGQTGQYDAFGHQTDGRETFMRDLVWGAVVDWRRECPIRPSEAESTAKAGEKYQIYEAQVSARGTGATKTAALDTEGRGPVEFWAKWQHAMKLWDTKVAEEAQKPGKSNGEYSTRSDNFLHDLPVTGQPLILTSAEFLAGYTPPAYLIDDVIQRGYLYSLTARTGHGKTAVALYMAQAIARGNEMHGHKVLSGTVLILAGENPDDVRARYFVLGDAYSFNPALAKIRWIPGVKNASKDNLLPMGGSAFLNEVDGNLTLWAGVERQTTLHWQGKFRGPEFDPMTFELVEAHCDAVKNEAGVLLPSVVAKPMAEAEVEAAEDRAEQEEDRLMRAMYSSPAASWADLASQLNWKKRKVQRLIERLDEGKFVEQKRNKRYALTDKGTEAIGGLKKGRHHD
jgi:predicted transcriptional regulator